MAPSQPMYQALVRRVEKRPGGLLAVAQGLFIASDVRDIMDYGHYAEVAVLVAVLDR